MASPTSVLSKTLQSITLTKIKELERQRHSYETRKREFLARAEACEDPRDRLACLLDGIRALYPAAASDDGIANMERWLQQSRYDASVPLSTLQSYDTKLRKKLDIQSRKLSLADLYSRLLTEWMNPPPPPRPLEAAEAGQPEDAFEVVERQKERLGELVDKFESVVFEPCETSERRIFDFLDGLFADDDARKALASLRKDMTAATRDLMAERAPFGESSLKRCIKGLLTEDLLSDEKQAILRDFLDNAAALREIADVLNMRFTDLRQWEWDAGDEGIRVMPRQQLNGKYRIWADEDILQMIFVQYIGVRLCNLLKQTLKKSIAEPGVWSWGGGAAEPTPTQRDLDRRRFFTWRPADPANTAAERKARYVGNFFLSQLPEGETSLYEGANGGYDGDGGGEDEDEDAEAGEAGENGPREKPSGIKQRLLRQLASDMLLHRLRGVTHGEPLEWGEGVAVLQTDLQWYATALPHSTVYAAMRYIGFTEDWVAFFKKYLEAPLNLDSSSEHRAPTGPRIRKRGVPMAHASEKLVGELVLFFLDLAVNRLTGMLLYRVHDDIWLCGEPAACAEAWAHMQAFAEVFGLQFNRSKTGSVYLAGPGRRDSGVAAALPRGAVTVGFLKLDPASGDWAIDQGRVDAHVRQLQKQLAACDSVLAWVQTWNSCIGRFFSHTFGEPAYCFGREHIDGILRAYERMQQALFGPGGNVVEHLKRMIRARFGAEDLPDAFVFLPERLGGLGVRNPFVGLFLVRDEVGQTPRQILEAFLEAERDDYDQLRQKFEAADEASLRRRFRSVFGEPPGGAALPEIPLAPGGRREFLPLAEFGRFRGAASRTLHATYSRLLSVPQAKEVALGDEVRAALQGAGVDGAEKRWIAQQYADELFEACGGISLVDRQFLPVGVLNMKRGKKVAWQMVL